MSDPIQESHSNKLLPFLPAMPPPPHIRNRSRKRKMLISLGRWITGLANEFTIDSRIQHLMGPGAPTRDTLACVIILGHSGYFDPVRTQTQLWNLFHLVFIASEVTRFGIGAKELTDILDVQAVPDTSMPAGAEDEIDDLVDRIIQIMRESKDLPLEQRSLPAWYASGELLKAEQKGMERLNSHAMLHLIMRQLEKTGEIDKLRVLVVHQDGGNGGLDTRAANQGVRISVGEAVNRFVSDLAYNMVRYPITSFRKGLVAQKRVVKYTIHDLSEQLLSARADVAKQNQMLSDIVNKPDPKWGRPNPALYYPVRHSDQSSVHLIADSEGVFKLEQKKSRLTDVEKVQRIQEVRQFLANLSGKPVEAITDDARLDADLSLRSLEISVDVLSKVNSYGFSFDSVEAFGLERTVGNVLKAACDEIPETTGMEFAPVSEAWQAQQTDSSAMRLPARIPKSGDNIASKVYWSLQEHKNKVIASDDIVGEVTGAHMLTTLALTIKQLEADVPEKNIATIFPSSVMNSVFYLACLLTGKRYTAISSEMTDAQAAHVIACTSTERIFAPMKVIRAMKAAKTLADAEALGRGIQPHPSVQTTLPSIEHLLTPIENLTRKFRLKDVLKLKMLPFTPASREVQRRLRNVPEEALLLATSGSTGNPGVVVQNQAGVLANCQALAAHLEVRQGDTLCAFAPFYHVVGFYTTLMALLSGVQTHYIPDPRKAAVVAEAMRRRGCTIAIATPKLLQRVCQVAGTADAHNPEKGLPKLRLVLHGAEAPDEATLAQVRATAPNAEVVPGYGSTEDGPVNIGKHPLTENEKAQIRDLGLDPSKWIGDPLSCFDTAFADPEDLTRFVPSGEPGAYMVRGPSVMKEEQGYLGRPLEEKAFVEVAGKRYRNTGDLIQRVTIRGESGVPKEVDIFVGRLGRFSKVNGVMVGHEDIESMLKQIVGEPREGTYPVLVVPGMSEDDPPIAYVASDVDGNGEPLTFDKVASTIIEMKESKTNWVPEEIRFKPDGIPALPTGKVNLRVMKELAKQPHDENLTLTRARTRFGARVS